MRIKLNDKISIDLAKLIESRLLVQANSGGGKSWANRRIIEQAFGHVQIIVIDPEGEFGNMRGEYDFVYCGKGGDAPVESRSAALLARRLLELKASAIVDLYELPMQERKHFVKLFLDSMVNAPKELWHDCLVILDEAHKFAPEKEQSEALEAVADMASRGRKRGYCLIPATQRPAKLNKDVAAECNNKIIGRASLDIDRKRSAEELGFTTREEVLSLRDLEPGEFYCFGPAIGRDIIKTKIGDVIVKPATRGQSSKAIPAPTQKVKEILAKLSDLPKEAQREAQSIAELKLEISNLKGEIKRNTVYPGQKITVSAVDVKALESKIKGLERIIAAYESNIEKWGKYADDLLWIVEHNYKTFKDAKRPIKIQHKLFSEGGEIEMVKPINGMIAGVPIPMFSYKENKEEDIGICAKKIYSFLVKNSQRSWTKVQVAAITGYSPESGGFNNSIAKLNSLGLIMRVAGSLARRGDIEMKWIVDIEEYTPDIWYRKLGKCEREIFKFLSERPGGKFSKERIGDEIRYSANSGGFNNAIAHLNSIGLVRRVNGELEINPELLEL